LSLPRHLSSSHSVPGTFRPKPWIARCACAFIGAVLLGPSSLRAQTVTQTLRVVISPLGNLFAFPNSVALSRSGVAFNSYTGTLRIQYRGRTTQATGTGTITVQATADFAPAGGPSIATPPNTSDVLTYTCSSATLGTPCSGQQKVSTNASTNVVTLSASQCTGGGGPCSSTDPDTVDLMFTLSDDPQYKVGSYSATLTFTISAS